MTYSVFDCTGNLVDSLDNRKAALAALTSIASTDPDAAEDVFLIT